MDKVVNLGEDLARALRKLRRDMQRCETCKNEDDCKLKAYFQTQIDTAITQINEESNMTNTP